MTSQQTINYDVSSITFAIILIIAGIILFFFWIIDSYNFDNNVVPCYDSNRNIILNTECKNVNHNDQILIAIVFTSLGVGILFINGIIIRFLILKGYKFNFTK